MQAAVDPGELELDCGLIEQEARFEIIGAVEDDVAAGGEREDIARRDIGDDRLDFNRTIDLPQLFGSGHGFRQRGGNVGFVVEHLPLQIVELEEVAIDQP